MEDSKYLYSIKPTKMIKDVAGFNAIRTSKSLFLTKDEVLKCIKCGTVYRRFSADKIIKVTPATLDRLHRDEFLSEKEYEKFLADSQGKDRGNVEKVNTTADSKEAIADANTAQNDATSANNDEASSDISDESDNTNNVVASVSDNANDQVETATGTIEADANDHDSDNEESTVVDTVEVSVSDNANVKDEVTSAQVQVDQDADEKTGSFQSSAIQLNNYSSNKKKNKNKH